MSKALVYFCLVTVLVTPQEQPSPAPLLVKIWVMNSCVKIYWAARNLLVDNWSLFLFQFFFLCILLYSDQVLFKKIPRFLRVLSKMEYFKTI